MPNVDTEPYVQYQQGNTWCIPIATQQVRPLLNEQDQMIPSNIQQIQG